MKNKSPTKLVVHLTDRWVDALKADVAIRNTTDDQYMLWLASDALQQAQLDLREAIEEANQLKKPKAQLVSARITLLAISAFKQYVAFLRIFPPSLLMLPVLIAQLSLMMYGTYWLLFGLHINYWFVLPFVIANIVAFRFIYHASDQQVLFVLKKAQELAQTAKRRYSESHHPSIAWRIAQLNSYENRISPEQKHE